METTATETTESAADQTETVETEASEQQTGEVESGATEAEGSETGTSEQESEQATSDAEPPLPKWLDAYDKVLVDEYFDRFQLTQEQLQNPQTKSFFKAVLDKEQYIAKLKGGVQDESTEEGAGETEAVQPKNADEQFTEYSKGLDDFVAKGRGGEPLNDPRMVEAFASEWLAGQGITKPEQIAELKKQGFDPVRMANAYSKFGTNLVATVLPAFIERALESKFPGFGELFNNATEGNSWEGLRGKENYAQLPEYGTQSYRDAMQEVEKANPWFKDAQFKTRGARLEALASLALGRRVDPKLMEQAVATGEKKANKDAKKLAVASSLGAGKSKGELTPKPKGNDALRAGIATYMDSQRSGNK